MKVFILTLTLLTVGLVFIAPPLIVAAPALFLGLLLMASPVLLRGMSDDGRGDSRVPSTRRPTPHDTPRR